MLKNRLNSDSAVRKILHFLKMNIYTPTKAIEFDTYYITEPIMTHKETILIVDFTEHVHVFITFSHHIATLHITSHLSLHLIESSNATIYL